MNILLGVSGSIACYKSYDITRELIKRGHQVRVVLTRGAMAFIKKELFFHLGAQKVYEAHDDFNTELTSSKERVLHIELVNWAQKIVLAPLSANSLAKLAQGLCDDLLSSVMLARADLPTLIFPAMNTRMWENSITQKNCQSLKELEKIHLYSPSSGKLACGDRGPGKLLAVEEILELVETTNFLKVSKKVLITTGATQAPLDPVRFLTNPASGKTGLELAKAYLKKGHQVIVVAGKQSCPELKLLERHPNYQLHTVGTSKEMQAVVMEQIEKADIYISSAAISDIEFKVAPNKLKKESFQGMLEVQAAPDILAQVIKQKKAHQQIISFAAETDTSEQVFKEKMIRKPVHLMIGNQVNNGLNNNQIQGFQGQENNYFFVTKDSCQELGQLTKTELAEKILQFTETSQAQ